MKVWIEAMRLRTLPLSAAGVIIAAGLAFYFGCFRIAVFIPMLIMVLIIQIISNFADEYGDLDKGLDDANRVGPVRAMQRGEITRESMKHALVLSTVLVTAVALWLLFVSFGLELWYYILLFMGLGALCIVAAIKYTVGRGAYGYYGLGDLSSFVFFGLVAVVGGFFLYAHAVLPVVFLPAIALGSLVTAMLNLNNMRDMETDRAGGRRTVAGALGRRGALAYHAILICVGFAGFLVFSISCGMTSPVRYAYILLYIPLAMQLVQTLRITDNARYDTLMKPHSMTTAALALAFAICIAI